jgi:hypothetical protein
MRRFGTARTASLKEESVMAAFRKSWTLASVGLPALALLHLRSDPDALSANSLVETPARSRSYLYGPYQSQHTSMR